MQRNLLFGLSCVIAAFWALPALALEQPMVAVAQSIASASREDVQLFEGISAAQRSAAVMGTECQELEFSADSLAASVMSQKAQLDCLGEELARGCRDWDSPFSGSITYRMRFSGSGLADLGDFRQGLRFDLSYREWVTDNLLLNFEIGSSDSSVFDVISGRHGSDSQLERAYVEGHFGRLD